MGRRSVLLRLFTFTIFVHLPSTSISLLYTLLPTLPTPLRLFPSAARLVLILLLFTSPLLASPLLFHPPSARFHTLDKPLGSHLS